jgi:hypothetical protein
MLGRKSGMQERDPLFVSAAGTNKACDDVVASQQEVSTAKKAMWLGRLRIPKEETPGPVPTPVVGWCSANHCMHLYNIYKKMNVFVALLSHPGPLYSVSL